MLKQSYSNQTNKGKAIAQLQGLVTAVVAGTAADTDQVLAGVKFTDHVESAFGVDPGTAVADFTGTAVIVAPTAGGAIEGITLPSAAEVSINLTGHGFVAGDEVVFADVGGTVELNGLHFTVLAATDADNFTLTGTDGDNFTAWTSGGTVSGYNLGRLQNTADTTGYSLMVRILRA